MSTHQSAHKHALANIPEPQLRQRTVNPDIERSAQALGLSPAAARVFGARCIPDAVKPEAFLRARVQDLDRPDSLKGIERAAARIADAITTKALVVLYCDYDADGTSASACCYEVFTRYFRHPVERTITMVGNRLTDGYGLTDTVADRILAMAPKPSLVITMDCGSSDQKRIRRLADAGIDVIVTDHHEVPTEGVPRAAYVTVNPNQTGCQFPDKAIAGCHTVWLVLAAARQELIRRGHLPETAPSLIELTDYVSISTVADCVSLASVNNRAVVRAGLRRINAGARPPWRALQTYLRRNSQRPITAATIAFGIAPRINAPSRVQDPMVALDFLKSADDHEAARYAAILDEENRYRRCLEQRLQATAMLEAVELRQRGKVSLAVLLVDGHPGLSGIVASRLVEAFGMPSIVFAPHRTTGELTGSARSIDGLHIRDCLADIADNYADLLIKWGGHAMAAGVSIDLKDFDLFARAFDLAVRKRLGNDCPAPVIRTDGRLQPGEISLPTLDDLAHLEPFGRGFEAPIFDGDFEVVDVRPVGSDQTHLQLYVRADTTIAKAMWFRARASDADPMPVARGDRIHAAYELTDDSHNGRRAVCLRIVYAKRTAVAKRPPKRYI